MTIVLDRFKWDHCFHLDRGMELRGALSALSPIRIYISWSEQCFGTGWSHRATQQAFSNSGVMVTWHTHTNNSPGRLQLFKWFPGVGQPDMTGVPCATWVGIRKEKKKKRLQAHLQVQNKGHGLYTWGEEFLAFQLMSKSLSMNTSLHYCGPYFFYIRCMSAIKI